MKKLTFVLLSWILFGSLFAQSLHVDAWKLEKNQKAEKPIQIINGTYVGYKSANKAAPVRVIDRPTYPEIKPAEPVFNYQVVPEATGTEQFRTPDGKIILAKPNQFEQVITEKGTENRLYNIPAKPDEFRIFAVNYGVGSVRYITEDNVVQDMNKPNEQFLTFYAKYLTSGSSQYRYEIKHVNKDHIFRIEPVAK